MTLITPRTSRLVLACLITFTLAFSLVPFANPAYAETSKEVGAQAEELQRKADELAARIDELATQLVEAHQKEDEATARYEAAEAAKKEALDRKAAAEKIMAETQERLSARVVSVYRNGGTSSLIDVLLGAGTFEEFLTTFDAIQTINNQDSELIETNRNAREEAAAAAEEYATQSAIAKEELDNATAARKQIEVAEAEMNKQLVDMNEEIAVLIAKKEELEEEEAEAARKAAEAAAAQSGGGTYSGTDTTPSMDSSFFSGWVYPVNYSYVSCEFGYSPITYSHNGIDLVASAGTPIHAAGPGTVTYVGWYGTGGNSVIISHGSGVQTIYMHQSQTAATVGEYVNAGDLIGYVGSTGLSTGPHLHFQLVIDGVPTNPRTYFDF